MEPRGARPARGTGVSGWRVIRTRRKAQTLTCARHPSLSASPTARSVLQRVPQPSGNRPTAPGRRWHTTSTPSPAARPARAAPASVVGASSERVGERRPLPAPVTLRSALAPAPAQCCSGCRNRAETGQPHLVAAGIRHQHQVHQPGPARGTGVRGWRVIRTRRKAQTLTCARHPSISASPTARSVLQRVPQPSGNRPTAPGRRWHTTSTP